MCPSLNDGNREKMETCYATYAKDKTLLIQGSSGGIFGILARHIISKGGVVYGAAFDNNLKLRHQRATTLDELMPLLKSKYVQSACDGIYNEVRADLKAGKVVLFSGTPCQCNAVSNYLGAQYNNLYVVDVVCHGTPSQQLFDTCIEDYEHQNGCKVTNFQFRYKGPEVKHPHSYCMVTEKNGKKRKIVGLHYQFPFYFCFQSYISLRNSCYQCKQATPARNSDITLADFWGIEKHNPNLIANEGISMVAPHSQKGLDLFEAIRKEYDIYCEKVPYDFAVANNGNLMAPIRKTPRRDAFFEALRTKPFCEVKQEYMKSKRQYIFDIYYAIPSPIRKIVRKIMENRMKYE
jgi:coenzyme F420-reducing hydrogenase beta subunit